MATNPLPQVGESAPSFSLQGTGGKHIALEDFLGKKNLVLFFYPKDGTPGCTLEACGFRDAFEMFEAHDTVVVGVSGDGLDSHEIFSSKHQLPFTLLSDPGTEVARAYGVYSKKSLMGREFFGISRTTFVIDKRGRIRKIYPRVQVKEHAAEILGFLRDELA